MQPSQPQDMFFQKYVFPWLISLCQLGYGLAHKVKDLFTLQGGYPVIDAGCTCRPVFFVFLEGKDTKAFSPW